MCSYNPMTRTSERRITPTTDQDDREKLVGEAH